MKTVKLQFEEQTNVYREHERKGRKKMMTFLMIKNYLNSLQSEEGQGLAEYALIIVLVSIAVVITLGTLGDTVNGVFEGIVGELAPA
ncbi:MAG: hypothetical protein R2932_04845 [Caldilineaceae bacterium]